MVPRGDTRDTVGFDVEGIVLGVVVLTGVLAA